MEKTPRKERLEEMTGEKVTRELLLLRMFIKFIFYVKTVLSTLSFYSEVTTPPPPPPSPPLLSVMFTEILAVLGSMK